MVRFVLAPDGSVVPDLKMRLPGRGVWVTADSEIIRQACEKRLFARGFKEKVGDCSHLPDLVAEQMTVACLSALSMTRKAGQIVTGFAKVEAAIARKPVIGVIHAADAAQDGQKKLSQAIRRQFGSEDRMTVIRLFCAEALSQALGHGNVVHAALLAGSASRTFVNQAVKLERFDSNRLENAEGGTATPPIQEGLL